MTQPKPRVACNRMPRCQVAIRLTSLLFEHGFGVFFASFNLTCKSHPHSLRSLPHCGEPLCQGCLSPEPLTQWQLRRDSTGGAELAGRGGDRASQPPLPGHGVHVRDAVPFLLAVVLGLGSDKPGCPSVPSYMPGKNGLGFALT